MQKLPAKWILERSTVSNKRLEILIRFQSQKSRRGQAGLMNSTIFDILRTIKMLREAENDKTSSRD